MATALKSPRPNPQSRGKQRSQRRSHLQPVQPAAKTPAKPRQSPRPPLTVVPGGSMHPGVRQLPTRRPFPTWLRLLIQLQRGSLIVTFVLVTAALVVYSSTIYMQQHWSKEYRKLKTMQRSERQMVAAEGFLKNQLIQQAEQPGSGLVPRTTEHTIFLDPSPARPPVSTINPIIRQAEPSQNSAPLGY